MDAIFAVEREINGRPPTARQSVRTDHSSPLVVALQMGRGVHGRSKSTIVEIGEVGRGVDGARRFGF